MTRSKKRHFSVFFLPLVALWASPAVQGATYNVTITQANAGTYAPDDIVQIIPGTYATPLTVPSSGTSGHPIIYDGAGVKIDCAAASSVGIQGNNKSYITVKNFEVTRCRSGGATGYTGGDSGNHTPGQAGTGVTFQNLWLHANTVAGTPSGSFGISLTGTIDSTATACTVEDESTSSAALRANGATNPTFTNCIARRIVNDGVHFINCTGGVLERSWVGPMATNDQSPPAHSDGIVIISSTNTTIRQNVIRQWTQLQYPTADAVNQGLNGVFVYSNFIYGIPGNVIPQYGDFTSPSSGAPYWFQAINDATSYFNNVQFFWNTIGWTGGPGHFYQGGTPFVPVTQGALIYNNIFYKTRGTATNVAFDVDNKPLQVADYNDYVTCSASSIEGGHSLAVDPQFTNYNAQTGAGLDVSLSAHGNPIVAGGKPSLSSFVTITSAKDLANNTRLSTGVTTMGALEWGSAMPLESAAGYQSSGGGASARCGDGVVQNGEQCDDGNTNDNDACTNACLNAVCGDGIVRAGTEQCDDGNVINTDGCTNTCTLPRCGDGIVQAGEQCDDGNQNNSDACRNNCSLPTCGDGTLDAGEECDDHNQTAGDGCSATCRLERCGNNTLDPGEQCDGTSAAACGSGTGSCLSDCTCQQTVSAATGITLLRLNMRFLIEGITQVTDDSGAKNFQAIPFEYYKTLRSSGSDAAWYKHYTTSTTGNNTLDLSALPADVFGRVIQFGSIKAFVVRADDTPTTCVLTLTSQLLGGTQTVGAGGVFVHAETNSGLDPRPLPNLIVWGGGAACGYTVLVAGVKQ